ncbi:MAG: tetratricopeptide repeat protein, partial [Anaerolineae bacterium]
VFYTPFSDAGAAAVADLSPAAWSQARELLRTRSLLYQEGERCRFHPLVRDFGLARLTDPAAAQRRAAQFLTDLWQSGGDVNPHEVLAVPRHWLAAGDWPTAAGTAADLTGGHDRSLDRRGYWNEIAVILRIVIESRQIGQEETVVDLWNRLSNVLRLAGDYTNALASAQRGLALARQVGARLGEANVLQAIGDVQQFRDDREGALALYGQALELFRQVGDRLGEANVLAASGQLDLTRGQPIQAQILLHEAVQIYEAIGSRYSIAAQTGNYGWTLRRIGQAEQARPYLLQAAELFEQMGLNDYAQRHRQAAESGDQMARLLQQWQPILETLAAAVQGDDGARREFLSRIEPLQKTADWRHLCEALQHILAGERDPGVLAGGLDDVDRAILAAALSRVAAKPG